MSTRTPPRSAPPGAPGVAPPLRVVGRGLPRVDGRALVTGSPVYTADMDVPDMLHGKILHSPLAHARIVAIDTGAARALPGVRAVLTHLDVPAILHATAGQPFPELSPYDTRLLDPHLRYVGDWVALVAAESEAIAEAALALIKVTYQELPAVFDPVEAMRDGAPKLHEPDVAHPLFERSPGPTYDARHNIAGHEEIWRGADFATTMAAADHIEIAIEGKGGHAARPHLAIDTILVGAQIINQLQSIVARNVDPLQAAVVSICMFQAGHTDNVIPQHARLRGTARSLTAEVGELLHKRIGEVVEGTARLYGATAKVSCTNGYPVLVNHERQTAFAAAVAREIAGHDKVDTDVPPVMGAEDFAFMLAERPGAFIFVGNGDSAGLHHPAYDFNDEATPVGTSYWVRLAETALGG